MSLAKQLRDARAILATGAWCQGKYFSLSLPVSHGRVCMCAHGAVQTIINPCVRSCIGRPDDPSVSNVGLADAAEYVARAAVAAYSGESGYAQEMAAASRDGATGPEAVKLAKVRSYMVRPEWVKYEWPCSTDTSYILGIVGLTTFYNDLPSTTLDDVLSKYDDAIALAELLESCEASVIALA